MVRYFLVRILLAMLTVFILFTICYFLTQINYEKNGPIDINDFPGSNPNERELARLAYIKSVGLDKSVQERYLIYISNFFKGNFGQVYNYNNRDMKVTDTFFSRLNYTIIVTAPSFVLSVIFGAVLGYWSGYRARKPADTIINFIVTVFDALPSFVLALILVLVGSKLSIPVTYIDKDISLIYSIKSLIVPIIVLTLSGLSGITLLIRNEVSLILNSDYIQIARAKGLSEREIFFKYVFRNSCVPIVRFTAGLAIGLITGSLVLEIFFGIPGTATFLTSATRTSEFNIISFNIIFFTSISLLFEITMDFVLTLIDPRIRLARRKNSVLGLRIKRYVRNLKVGKQNG
jgi:oligopeptide transport system permease protein